MNKWLLADGNRKKTIGNWTDQSVCSVSGQSGVSRKTRMSGHPNRLNYLVRIVCLDSVECLGRIECLDTWVS